MRPSVLFAGLFGASLFVACGPSGTSSTPVGDSFAGADADGSKPVPASLIQFKSQLLSRYCEVLLECADGSNLGGFGFIFDNASQCQQFFGASLDAGLAGLEEAIGSGAVTFDPQAGSACLNSLQTQALCMGIGGLGGFCPEAFVGSAAEGTSCRVNEACQPGLYCQKNACDGICTAKTAAGQPCQSADECLDSESGPAAATCDAESSFGPARCFSTTVDPSFAAVGAPCGVTIEGSQRRIVGCIDGAYCNEELDSMAGTCELFAQPGQSCFEDQRCAPESACVPGRQSATCTSYTLHKAVGASCAPTELAVCDPISRLYCDVSSLTCQALGDGSIGAVCSNTGFAIGVPGAVCDAGNYCDDTTKRCAALKADGESCSDSDECASDSCDGEFCVASSCP